MPEEKHVCTKEDIEWTMGLDFDKGQDTQVAYSGRCRVCGRRVYEVYKQCDELYDYKTDKEIA